MIVHGNLRALADAIVERSSRTPGDGAVLLEQIVVAVYRNGIVDSARVCQEEMRRHQAAATHARPGQRELYEQDAAGRAAFECSELILDKVITVDVALRGIE